MKKLFTLIAVFFVIFLMFNLKKIFQPKDITIIPTTTTTTTKEINFKEMNWGLDTNAPFQARDSHGTVVFDDAIWVMGGLDGNSVTQGSMVQYW